VAGVDPSDLSTLLGIGDWSLPPLGVVASLALGLWLLYRAFDWLAHLVVWTIERVRGREELYADRTPAGSTLGWRGVARTDLAPRGKVFVRGELWNAVSERPVAAGEGVEIVDADGLTLRVRPAGTRPAGERSMTDGKERGNDAGR
jgi:membrane protein implicated in regulation of membrane protease activity